MCCENTESGRTACTNGDFFLVIPRGLCYKSGKKGVCMSDIKFPSGFKMLSVDDLVPFAKNPKIHEDKDIGLIIKSIQRNGWSEPLLVSPETMEVLSGNGRLLAAKKIGLKEVPVVFAPEGLSEKQKADIVIASNKLVEVSGYNDNLTALIEEFELEASDFGMELDFSTEEDEPKENTKDSIKKVKLSFTYDDSREIIDTFIREMNKLHPELMKKVEIND